jgi:hypothetical protein
MPRPRSVRLALALLLFAVPTAHAQLGGLKKKLVDKATGRDTVAAGKGAAKCDASSMVISGDVVDRYLRSLAARDAEIQKLAKEPGKTGAYYSALFKRQAVEKRKAEYDLRRGPDWEKNKALSKRLRSGDAAAAREQAALGESLNPSSVQVPALEWESQQKINARVDSVMMRAGGFSECDWSTLGERLPRMIDILAHHPEEFKGYGTEKEAAAIRPRMTELTRALGYPYVWTAADSARVKAEDEALAEVMTEPASTGNPQTDCMLKIQRQWTKAHKAELEAAQDKGDQNTLMRLSMEMNAELAKCSP